MAKGAESQRYRLSVPPSDVSVIEWLDNQYNISFSLRTIIKDWITRNGMGDATCSAAEKINRGRPTKKAQEILAQAEEAVTHPQVQYSEPVSDTAMRGAQQSASYPPETYHGGASDVQEPVPVRQNAGMMQSGQRQQSSQQFAQSQMSGMQSTGAQRAAAMLDM